MQENFDSEKKIDEMYKIGILFGNVGENYSQRKSRTKNGDGGGGGDDF
jgi:hypothetical protein